MTALLGSIGWGLLTIGAVTHLWHHRRLRTLLAMHLDYERVPAAALTGIEALLAVLIPIGFLSDAAWLRWAALVATALAVGFVVWIARLLVSDSALPCACSFSEAPTSVWSLLRAICVVAVVLIVWAEPSTGQAVDAATLATGLAVAAAIFVLPEALAWPEPSRALLARVDAYDQNSAQAMRGS